MGDGTTREERDSLGAVAVPLDAYYGAQTERGRQNFDVSGQTIGDFPGYVHAIVEVKKAAALANADIGVVRQPVADAICQAADEILAGRFDRTQFPIDMMSAGGGVSPNMNVNEVLANRANEILTGTKGYEFVHPQQPREHRPVDERRPRDGDEHHPAPRHPRARRERAAARGGDRREDRAVQRHGEAVANVLAGCGAGHVRAGVRRVPRGRAPRRGAADRGRRGVPRRADGRHGRRHGTRRRGGLRRADLPAAARGDGPRAAPAPELLRRVSERRRVPVHLDDVQGSRHQPLEDVEGPAAAGERAACRDGGDLAAGRAGGLVVPTGQDQSRHAGAHGADRLSGLWQRHRRDDGRRGRRARLQRLDRRDRQEPVGVLPAADVRHPAVRREVPAGAGGPRGSLQGQRGEHPCAVVDRRDGVRL